MKYNNIMYLCLHTLYNIILQVINNNRMIYKKNKFTPKLVWHIIIDSFIIVNECILNFKFNYNIV